MMLPLVAVDTETALIGTGRKAPPLVCVSVSREGDGGKGTLHSWNDKKTIFELWEGAASGRHRLLFHNAPFDAAVFAAQYPALIPTIFKAYEVDGVGDTMIRQLLLDLERDGRCYRKALAGLAAKYTGQVMEKGEDTWRLRYWKLRNRLIRDWPEAARAYAIADATILLPIHRGQNDAAIHHDVFADEDAQCRAHFAFHLMATWGLKTDVQHVEDLISQFETLNAERKAILVEAGIMREKGSVITSALVEYIESGGVELPLTKTGRPSLKKEILEAIDDPIIKTHLSYKEDVKMTNTYLTKYTSGLVQCTVNPLLANGRSSLAKPSLQNLPRSGPIRESFVPRDGNVLCAVDYDVVEMRTLGQACLSILGRSELARHFQDDPHTDPHTVFGERLGGEGARQRAKAANFGFPGGMGIARFVQAQAMQGAAYTESQAKALKKQYMDQWQLVPYFKYVDRVEKAGAGMRCLVSGRYRGNVGYCEIANGYFSSLMADGAKAATFEVVRQCYAVPSSTLFGSRVVNAVHDEVVMELPKEGAHDIAHEVSRIMCDVMHSGYTPDVPITAKPALMTRWFKGAEPTYDKHNRLIPWK